MFEVLLSQQKRIFRQSKYLIRLQPLIFCPIIYIGVIFTSTNIDMRLKQIFFSWWFIEGWHTRICCKIKAWTQCSLFSVCVQNESGIFDSHFSQSCTVGILLKSPDYQTPAPLFVSSNSSLDGAYMCLYLLSLCFQNVLVSIISCGICRQTHINCIKRLTITCSHTEHLD